MGRSNKSNKWKILLFQCKSLQRHCKQNHAHNCIEYKQKRERKCKYSSGDYVQIKWVNKRVKQFQLTSEQKKKKNSA